MARQMMILAAFLGALAVILGAFGAHGLQAFFQGMDDGAKRQEWWGKAVNYHMWHSLLLVMVALVADRASTMEKGSLRIYRVAAVSLGLGILLFSGSLYTMALTGMRWLGMITPLGGIAFIVGWVSLAIGARQSFPSDSK
jgi:uncharacterized membrane protein YgdD (TMEM256/DUF423 family)